MIVLDEVIRSSFVETIKLLLSHPKVDKYNLNMNVSSFVNSDEVKKILLNKY